MASQKKSTVDRRSFLAAGAAGAVAVANAPEALAKVAIGTELGAGSPLGGGWYVQRIEDVSAGAIRIVASHTETGRLANVGVCRAEAGSGALASTGAVDLFLMNDGKDGRALTPDDEVRMVRSVAKLLEGNEDRLPGALRLLGRKARQEAYQPIDHLDPIARHE
jgi:hypothetical protein